MLLCSPAKMIHICCPAAKHESIAFLDLTYYGEWVQFGCISEWWDILLNKIILPEELRDKLIMSWPVCIISVSFLW